MDETYRLIVSRMLGPLRWSWHVVTEANQLIGAVDLDVPIDSSLSQLIGDREGVDVSGLTAFQSQVLEDTHRYILLPLQQYLTTGCNRTVIIVEKQNIHFLGIPFSLASKTNMNLKHLAWEYQVAPRGIEQRLGPTDRAYNHQRTVGNLVFVGAPGQGRIISSAAEYATISEIVGHEVDTVPFLSATQAATAIQSISTLRKPSLVHFASHGSPVGLLLEDDEGKPAVLPFADLLEPLETTDYISLIVVGACDTAASEDLRVALRAFKNLDQQAWREYTSEESNRARAGSTLLDIVLAADAPVIGAPGPIDDAFALAFSTALYQALSEMQMSLSASLRYANDAALANCPWALAVNAPVLIWPQERTTEDFRLPIVSATRTSNATNEIPAESIDPAALDAVVRHLRKGAPGVIAITGPPGAGKTTLGLQASRQMSAEGQRTVAIAELVSGTGTGTGPPYPSSCVVFWDDESCREHEKYFELDPALLELRHVMTFCSPSEAPSDALLVNISDPDRQTVARVARIYRPLRAVSESASSEITDYSFGLPSQLATIARQPALFWKYIVSNPTSGVLDMGERWRALRDLEPQDAIGPLASVRDWLVGEIAKLGDPERLLLSLIAMNLADLPVASLFADFAEARGDLLARPVEDELLGLYSAGLIELEPGEHLRVRRMRTCIRDCLLGERMLPVEVAAANDFVADVLMAVLSSPQLTVTSDYYQAYLTAAAFNRALAVDLGTLEDLLVALQDIYPSRSRTVTREIEMGLRARQVDLAEIADLFERIRSAGPRSKHLIYELAGARDVDGMKEVLDSSKDAEVDGISIEIWKTLMTLHRGRAEEAVEQLPQAWQLATAGSEAAQILVAQIELELLSHYPRLAEAADLSWPRVISTLREHMRLSVAACASLVSCLFRFMDNRDSVDGLLVEAEAAAHSLSSEYLMECLIPEARARLAVVSEDTKSAVAYLRRAVRAVYLLDDVEVRHRFAAIHNLLGAVLTVRFYRSSWGAILKLGYAVCASATSLEMHDLATLRASVARYTEVASMTSTKVFSTASDVLGFDVRQVFSKFECTEKDVARLIDDFDPVASSVVRSATDVWGHDAHLAAPLLAHAVSGDLWACFLLDSYVLDREIVDQRDGDSLVRAWESVSRDGAAYLDGLMLLDDARLLASTGNLPSLFEDVLERANWTIQRAAHAVSIAKGSDAEGLFVSVFGLFTSEFFAGDIMRTAPLVLASLDGAVVPPTAISDFDLAMAVYLMVAVAPQPRTTALLDIPQFEELIGAAASNIHACLSAISRGDASAHAVLSFFVQIATRLGITKPVIRLITAPNTFLVSVPEPTCKKIVDLLRGEPFLQGWLSFLQSSSSADPDADEFAEFILQLHPENLAARTRLIFSAVNAGDSKRALALARPNSKDPYEMQAFLFAISITDPMGAADGFEILARYGGVWLYSASANRAKALFLASKGETALKEFDRLRNVDPEVESASEWDALRSVIAAIKAQTRGGA